MSATVSSTFSRCFRRVAAGLAASLALGDGVEVALSKRHPTGLLDFMTRLSDRARRLLL
jgi:hypothetical protein